MQVFYLFFWSICVLGSKEYVIPREAGCTNGELYGMLA